MITGSNELVLEWLPGRYAVCRLSPRDFVPAWAQTSGVSLLSITRTDRELSIVIDESRVPADVKAQRDFVAMRIKGTLDFSLVGVLAKLTRALAAANVPVFVISTFETDVIMFRDEHQQRAIAAIETIGQMAPGMPGAK